MNVLNFSTASNKIFSERALFFSILTAFVSLFPLLLLNFSTLKNFSMIFIASFKLNFFPFYFIVHILPYSLVSLNLNL